MVRVPSTSRPHCAPQSSRPCRRSRPHGLQTQTPPESSIASWANRNWYTSPRDLFFCFRDACGAGKGDNSVWPRACADMHKDGLFIVVLCRFEPRFLSFPLCSSSRSFGTTTRVLFPQGLVCVFVFQVVPRMVPQISVFASAVIRLGLGLCFVASVVAFDMSLNSNVCLTFHVAHSLVYADHVCFRLSS